MAKSVMIVMGVPGRPTYASDGSLISCTYPTRHSFTPTLLRAVISGDLLEFEPETQVVQPEASRVDFESHEILPFAGKKSRQKDSDVKEDEHGS